MSEYTTIKEAVLDLAVREGSGRSSIGSYNKIQDEFSTKRFPYEEIIREWNRESDFDAVIWTNLGEKWEIKSEGEDAKKIDPENRIDYLKKLTGPISALAEQYIRRTPQQITTKYRKKIEEELGWLPMV